MRLPRLDTTLLVISLLALLPFLLLCAFNHPLGVHEWDWISGWNGQFAGQSFWREQAYWYRTTMGRYTSTALLSLTDDWYTLGRFQGLFVFFLLALPLGFFWLLRGLWPGTDRHSLLAFTGMITLAYLFQLSGVYDSLYRYSGVLTYQTGLIGTLAVAALVVRGLAAEERRWRYFPTAIFLAIFTVGTNEISLIALNLLLCLVVGARRWANLPVSAWLLALLLLTLAASLLALLAPGNFQRMDAYAEAFSLPRLLGLTTAVTGFLWLDWLADGLLIPLAVAAFLLRSWLGPSAFRLGHPLWWLVGMLVLTPGCIGLLLWSTKGASLPERVVDLLFAYNLLAWLGGWLAAVEYYKWPALRPSWWLAAGGIFFLLHAFGAGLRLDRSVASNHYLELLRTESPIGQAWLTVLTGAGGRYHQDKLRQYQELSQCVSDTCLVPPPRTFPPLLYDPLSDRLHQGGDPFMGAYFREGIRLVRYGN